MDKASEQKRRWGWGRIVLVASLALNLAVIGLIAGAIFRFGGDGHRTHSRDFAAPYIRALDHEDRKALREAVRRESRDGADNGMARQALYAEIGAALRADPFDSARVAALIGQQQAGFAARMSAAQDVWLRHVGKMTAQERAAYADRVEDHANRRSKRRGGS